MTMNVKDYAKYVVDNMSRATIGNALRIGLKLDVEDGYNFLEFLKEIELYITTLVSQNKYDKNKCYAIFTIISEATRKYNSNINYTKKYIINDFIIDLWKIIEGKL